MSELIDLLDDDSDSSPVSLAGATDIVSDFRINGEQVVQVAMGVRAANAKPINRGNVVNRVVLAITHAPAASALAAKQAAATLIAALTAKLVTATLLDLTIGSVVFRLSDAALLSYDIQARGTTVFASYNFSGGDFAELP